MPRAGWVKPETDQRLSDHISIGVLTRVFPPEVVDRVVNESGRTEQRQRLLPAGSSSTTCSVWRCSASAPTKRSCACWSRACRGKRAGPAPGTCRPRRRCSRPGPARARAGRGALPRCAVPLATKRTKGAFYRSWRLMSIDGTCLDVADTEANELAFGRPGSSA